MARQLAKMTVERTWFNIDEAMYIMGEVGKALAYAHQHNMIHRDIKPDNVMMAVDGRVVLTDFGLAKLVVALHLTAEGHMSGTPHYMAPEQIQSLSLDTRVDVYGLGVLVGNRAVTI